MSVIAAFLCVCRQRHAKEGGAQEGNEAAYQTVRKSPPPTLHPFVFVFPSGLPKVFLWFRLYEGLPEVLRKLEMERRDTQLRLNRLNLQIFNKVDTFDKISITHQISLYFLCANDDKYVFFLIERNAFLKKGFSAKIKTKKKSPP